MRQSRTPSPDGAQQAACVTVQGVGLQRKSQRVFIAASMIHNDELTASSLKDILIHRRVHLLAGEPLKKVLLEEEDPKKT